MEPLEPRHADQLYAAARDPRVWRLMRYNGVESRERFQGWMDDALDAWVTGTEYAFATVRRDDGRAVGSAVTCRCARTTGARDRLQLGHAGGMGQRGQHRGQAPDADARVRGARLPAGRVQDRRHNERSRAALAAIPATFEGVFRKHMLVRGGERRDSAWYSVIDDDWPPVKAALATRVDAPRGMTERRTYSTNTVFETRIGYDRALRVGDVVHVSGHARHRARRAAAGGRLRPGGGRAVRIQAALEALDATLPTWCARGCTWSTSSATSTTSAGRTASSSPTCAPSRR